MTKKVCRSVPLGRLLTGSRGIFGLKGAVNMPRTSVASAPKPMVREKVVRTTTEEHPATEFVPEEEKRQILKTPEDLWEYLANLTEQDWRQHRATLYRYPLGQQKPREMGRYVKVYTVRDGTQLAPLTSEEQIAEEFGGGQYDVMVRKGLTLIGRVSFDIEGAAKYPGVAAPAPAGTSELASTLQIVLDKLGKAQAANPSGSPAIIESVTLLKQITEAIPKPEGVAALVGALGEIQKLTGGGGNSTIETIKLLKELGIIGAPPQNQLQQVKDLLEIASMMGGGAGGRKDWGTALVENAPTILEKLNPIVDRIADAASNNRRTAELRAGIPQIPAAQPSRAQGAIPPAVPSPEPTPIDRATAQQPRTVAPLETEPMGGGHSAEQQAIAPMPPNLDWVKARVVQLFTAGKGGDEVAEFLDNLEPTLVNQLASLSPEQLEAFFRSDPILSQIAMAARCQDFLAEFLDYVSGEPATTRTQ